LSVSSLIFLTNSAVKVSMATTGRVTETERLYRETVELVSKTRLDAIEREHRYAAEILDKRTLFPLEEVDYKPMKLTKADIEGRVGSRRGARGEADIKSKAHKAVQQLQEQGVNVDLVTGGYEMEQRIWRDKASKKSYAEQRKFQQPKLESFLHRLLTGPVIQKNLYRERLAGVFISLVEKLRSECRELKSTWDTLGVFHSEANAHRAHCHYLALLHKHLCAAEIENVVLTQMLQEEEAIQREEMLRDEVCSYNRETEREQSRL
jgi:hypothetical protein